MVNRDIMEINEDLRRLFIEFFQEASKHEKILGSQAFHIIGFYNHFDEEHNISKTFTTSNENRVSD